MTNPYEFISNEFSDEVEPQTGIRPSEFAKYIQETAIAADFLADPEFTYAYVEFEQAAGPEPESPPHEQ